MSASAAAPATMQRGKIIIGPMATRLQSIVGKSVVSIDTPSLVIDLDAMERNLDRMASYASVNKILLRPHAKMHKSALLSRLQMERGAVGVCVQKTSEAEALAAGGVSNIFISNVVIAPFKLARVLETCYVCQGLGGQLSIAVDSVEGVNRLGDAAAKFTNSGKALKRPLDVFVEVNVGQNRCGCPPGKPVVDIVKSIQSTASLSFAGLHCYHGSSQHIRDPVDRKKAIEGSAEGVRLSLSALSAAGITVPLVTGGGSGSFVNETKSGLWGELQCGSYLFMDRDYSENTSDCDVEPFEHALFVKSQVISTCDTHVVVDAGHKSHAVDSGLPVVLNSRNLSFENGGDEHGILRGTLLPSLGEIIWLIPGHCDPTVNLHDYMVGVRGGLETGIVETIFKVDARGALT